MAHAINEVQRAAAKKHFIEAGNAYENAEVSGHKIKDVIAAYEDVLTAFKPGMDSGSDSCFTSREYAAAHNTSAQFVATLEEADKKHRAVTGRRQLKPNFKLDGLGNVRVPCPELGAETIEKLDPAKFTESVEAVLFQAGRHASECLQATNTTGIQTAAQLRDLLVEAVESPAFKDFATAYAEYQGADKGTGAPGTL